MMRTAIFNSAFRSRRRSAPPRKSVRGSKRRRSSRPTSCASAISSRTPAPLSNTPIFRAPDLGQTGAVPARAVLDAVRPYGLIAVDTRGLSEVSVTHASRTIAADDIEQRIVGALTTRYNLGKPENVKIMFDRDVRPIELALTSTSELSLARISYDTAARRFDVSFEVPGSARAHHGVSPAPRSRPSKPRCRPARSIAARSSRRATSRSSAGRKANSPASRRRWQRHCRACRAPHGARRPAAAQRRPDEARDRAEERHGAAALRSARHRADHARQGARQRRRGRHGERPQRPFEAHDPGHRHRLLAASPS